MFGDLFALAWIYYQFESKLKALRHKRMMAFLHPPSPKPQPHLNLNKKFKKSLLLTYYLSSLGTGGATKTDEFSENFRQMGHFQSKNLYYRIWTLKQGFLSMKWKKKKNDGGGRGGQRPLGTFPKIYPFQWRHSSLIEISTLFYRFYGNKITWIKKVSSPKNYFVLACLTFEGCGVTAQTSAGFRLKGADL